MPPKNGADLESGVDAVAWANETKGHLDQDFGPIAQRLVSARPLFPVLGSTAILKRMFLQVEIIAKCPGESQRLLVVLREILDDPILQPPSCTGFTQAQRDHYTFFSFDEFPPLIPATSLNSGLGEAPPLAQIDNAPSSESTGSWYPPSSPSNDLKGQEVLSTVGTYSISAPSFPEQRKKNRVERSSAPSPTGPRHENVTERDNEPTPTAPSGQPPLSLVP